MAYKHTLLLVTLFLIAPSHQNTANNEVDGDDTNPILEAASAILKEQTGENIGSLVNNFLQSGGAKQVGDALSNLSGENGGQLLQTLGSLLGNAGGGGGGNGLDAAALGSIMNLLNADKSDKKDNNSNKKQKSKSGFDIGDLISLVGSFVGSNKGEGSAEGFLEMLPMLIQTVNSFIGPEADRRTQSHEDHASLIPPAVERIHLFIDHFLHSEMGKSFINTIGAEKTFKIFLDDNGRFSYQKFGEMLENHSFRRHWISLVTKRIITFFTIVLDPKIQKKYVTSGQFLFNNYFKSQGFPKSAMFDSSRPTDSITAFVNHAVKKYIGIPFSAKQYVKPAVEYVQDVTRLVHKKGAILKNEDSRELSDKLADTINMEIIEPIVRVNRAFRFAKTVPECDRYVFCLVNEANPNEQLSLPGLKEALSKGASLLASWFLSEHTGTSFWTLYTHVMEDIHCKALYKEKCHDFHIEEEKVTTEYVHNEL